MNLRDIFLQATKISLPIFSINIGQLPPPPSRITEDVSSGAQETLSTQAFVDGYLSDTASEASFAERLRLAMIDEIDRVRRSMDLPRVAEAVAQKSRDADRPRKERFHNSEYMAQVTRALCRGY